MADRSPDLTEADIDIAIALVSEGQQVGTVARFLGVTRQALYNRIRRDAPPGFRCRIEEAQAQGEMHFVRKLIAAPPGEWQKFAWLLERRYKDSGWLSATDEAKVAEIARSQNADVMGAAARMRAFVERALDETQGDPNADPSAEEPA